MKKKIVSLCMVFALAVSTLAACSNKQNEKESSQQEVQQTTEATQSTEVKEEIPYPEQVSVFTVQGSNAKKLGFVDNNETYWAKWLEEKTGTKVTWNHPTSDVLKEKFTLMVASGQYADVVIMNWSGVEGGKKQYLNDEVIIDLTDLIWECMPNLSAYLDANPEVVLAISEDDGKILSIPYIRDELACSIFVGTLMRTDWIEKLGTKVPTTTDELYEVLKAFKEKDPNGNGEADEIPMSGVYFQGLTHGIGNLAWAFNAHYSWHVKDGKVVWGIAEKEFADALAYITKLYSEGLIDPDYLLNTRAKMDNKALADRVGLIFSYQATKYYNNADFNNGTRRMQGVPNFTNDGVHHTFNNAYLSRLNTSIELSITSKCQNPKSVLKWLDTMYSEEGLVVANFGQEGVDYQLVDGKPFVDYLTMDADKQALTKANNISIDTTFPTIQKWDGVSSTYSPWGREDIALWGSTADVSGILPKEVVWNDEEKAACSDAWTQLSAYADTIINKIVVGEESIDNWPKYVEEFKTMKLDEIAACYNAAYQRYLGKVK